MVSHRPYGKHKTMKSNNKRRRTHNRKKYNTIKHKLHVKRRKKLRSRSRSGSKSRSKSKKSKKMVKINKQFYARPNKKGGEFMLFPDLNDAKNGFFDGASNFFNGLQGVNNTETGNVMKQNLQSSTYDITGSKQLMDAAEKIVGNEPAPAPQPNPVR